MAFRARVRIVILKQQKQLWCRVDQVRHETKWPLEYSRKKWYMGPPQLPPEILEWERQLEQVRLEAIEAERNDIVPPEPKFRGSSEIGMSVPKIRSLETLKKVRERKKLLVEAKQEGGEEEEGKAVEVDEEDIDKEYEEMERVEEVLNYYKKCAALGKIPEKALGVRMHFKDLGYLLLQAGEDRDVVRGKWAHAYVLSRGHRNNRYLGNCTMIMYRKCGYLKDCQEVFDQIVWKTGFSWAILMKAYADSGDFKHAVFLFRKMIMENLHKPMQVAFSCLLTCIGALGDLKEGKKVHGWIREMGMNREVIAGNALISMYGKCGAVKEAKRVFERMEETDVVSWNALIAILIRNGYSHEVMKCLPEMEAEGVTPNMVTFMEICEALPASVDISTAKQVEKRMFDLGLEMKSKTALMKMYGRCGHIGESMRIFKGMAFKDLVAWTSMITAFAENGCGEEAVECYRRMQSEGWRPNNITFISIADACETLGDLNTVREIYSHLKESKFHSDTAVHNALLSLFGKSGSLEDAIDVFEKMPMRNLISWNALITSLVQNDMPEGVVEAYQQLQLEGEKPDNITLIGVLDGCSMLEDLALGEALHAHVEDSMFKQDVMVQNALVNMYGRCGSLDNARLVFEKMSSKDVVSWNAFISAAARGRSFREALELLKSMDLEGGKADRITFMSLAEACAGLADIDEGRRLHSRILSQGHYGSDKLKTAVLNMYGKSRSFTAARSVFNDIVDKDNVSWTALVGAATANGQSAETSKLLHEMDLHGAKLDSFTFSKLLDGCGSILHGKNLHSRIVESGIQRHVGLDTALLNMYSRCGSLSEAKEVFQQMNSRNVASWNSMLAAYAREGYAKETFKLFQRMDLEGFKPDEITFVTLLDACSIDPDRQQGDRMYERFLQSGFSSDMVVKTALCNLYARCGDLEQARVCFDKMVTKTQVSWSSMMGSFAQAGLATRAVELFAEMRQAGFEPDGVTFINLLSACSHSGLVEQGCHLFYALEQDHGLRAGSEHYKIMVDILGKAGWLEEAETMAKITPRGEGEGSGAWNTLLSACRTHGDVQRGLRAAEVVCEEDPQGPSSYLILSSIYSQDCEPSSLRKTSWEDDIVAATENKLFAVSGLTLREEVQDNLTLKLPPRRLKL